MRYLAVDFGFKRTGLAICDAQEIIASPLAVLEGSSRLPQRVAEFAAENAAEAIIIGLPYNMDGTVGGQAKAVKKFAAELEKVVDLPIHFQDERLSSFGAEEKIAAADFTRKKKKKRLDALAAAEILQQFLDSKHEEIP